MSIQALHQNQPVSFLGFKEPIRTSQKENLKVSQGKNQNLQLREFLSGWQLALSNANTDDWKMVVNTYSLFKDNHFQFPEEIDDIFLPSLSIDLLAFERSQQRQIIKMTKLISTYLDNTSKQASQRTIDTGREEKGGYDCSEKVDCREELCLVEKISKV